MSGRVMLSCYSCPYSTIYTSEGDKMVWCDLYNDKVKLHPGMSFPKWCGIKAINNRKGAKQ